MLHNIIRLVLFISVFSYLLSCGFKPMYKFTENGMGLSNFYINIINENNTSRQIKEEIRKSFPPSSEIEKDYVIDIEVFENLDPLITNTDGTVSKYRVEIILNFKVKTTDVNKTLIDDVVRGFAQYTVETSEIESDDKKKRMTRTATSGAVQMIISKIQSETLIKNDN